MIRRCLVDVFVILCFGLLVIGEGIPHFENMDFGEILHIIWSIFAVIGIVVVVKKIYEVEKSLNKPSEPEINKLQEEDQWRVRKYVHFLFSEMVKRGEVEWNIQRNPLPHLDFRREDLLETCESLLVEIKIIEEGTDIKFDFEEIQRAKKVIDEDKIVNQECEKLFENMRSNLRKWDIK